MLRKPDGTNQVMTAPVRIAALDRARTFIIVLVLLHHSVLNYTHFGNGDKQRWLGFDLVVLFNDSFFMAFMFFISGLFVRDSLVRKGPLIFLRDRAWRLGVPYLVSVVVLMPIAYYPTFLRYHLPGTTDFNFLHFWWRTLTVGPWPSGPAWFLWVLLAFDAIAAVLWAIAPQVIAAFGQLLFALRNRPMTAFALFLIFSIATYVPMRLAFGETSWLEFGRFPLPIQTSRILLYAGYFFVGIGVGAVSLRAGLLAENGELAKRWPVWLAFASVFYAAILVLVYARHNWVADPDSPPFGWRLGYSLAFAAYSAAMVFTVTSIFEHFAAARFPLLDAMQPSAYGIYLVHYVFIIWLQYVMYDFSFPAFVKFAIVFVGTLSLSWGLTLALRKIPVVARMI
ncbi:Acyltransferase family protein [Bradyrhizobium lablabi]|uniref:Acyltransferase family protein n=1 Tax=Bradyrhizobium lablabi TaxID=722472 RepID=A0A1M6YD83_9BRAD|nr:acyltransferase [Bradyrhizobium lablabi]SHL16266.1 Acyltransferase family protein [Bradyrhizobium lablabi]